MVLAALAVAIIPTAIACKGEHASTPEPTVVANAAVSTSEPTPAVRTRISTDHIPSTCEASYYRPTHHRHFIQWSRDDSLIVFDFDDAVWALTLEDSHLSKIVEATLGVGRGVLHLPIREEAPTRWRTANFGVHAHLSPDGTRIAYSSCQYDSMREKSGRSGFFHPVTVFTANEGPKLRYVHRVGYEIATVNIDGTDQRRLTDNDKLEHYPVWSPDGTRLAHIVSGFEVNSSGYDEEGTSLTVRPLGGLSPLDGTPEFMGAGLYPPAWSPDGTRIAFVYQQQLTVEEMRNIRRPKGEVIIHNPNPQFIYIINADGTDPVRIAEASTPPTWSPDSREVAFAHTSATSGESAIYVAAANGTDIRRIWSGEPDNLPPIKRISWSPDGSELLVVSGYLWAIGPDGNDIRHLATSTLQVAPDEAKRDSDGSVWVRGPVWPGIKLKDGSPIPRLDLDDAVWSSDGSRIAVYGWGRDRALVSFRVITMDRDGTDVRVVVKVDPDRGIHALEPPRSESKVGDTP